MIQFEYEAPSGVHTRGKLKTKQNKKPIVTTKQWWIRRLGQVSTESLYRVIKHDLSTLRPVPLLTAFIPSLFFSLEADQRGGRFHGAGTFRQP